MAIADIDSWISGKGPYETGIFLFKKFGNNQYLLKLFEGLENEDTRDMLEDELIEISAKQVEQKKGPDKKFIAPAEKKNYQDLPEEIRKLNEQKSVLYKEMSFLHSQLTEYELDEITGELVYKNFSSHEDAGVAAFRLLDLDDQLRCIWKKLDHYAEHGKLPDTPLIVIKEKTIVDMVRRRNTLRTYLSRDSENEKADAWRAELEELDRRIEE